jgi:inorganic phosphate transporter, PiT family
MLYFIPILLLTLIFGYLNSLNGAASIVATLISSRALSPRKALFLAALCMCAGPFLLGAAVAGTVGVDMVAPRAQTANVLIAALIGAIAWVLITVWLKIPSSTTQAFVGSLVGVVLIGFGHDAVLLPGLTKTLVAIFLSPILGIIGGYWLVKLCYSLSAEATPRINHKFKRGQIVMCALMAVAYGANDGQKIMGILAFGLVATGLLHSFTIPAWAVAFAAFTMGLGTLLGSWRLIKVLGSSLYQVRPVHGFGAQVASGTILLSASLLGGPVSSSQVITSAIVGAGSAQRVRQVRWQIVGRVMSGWLFTLPLSALAGALAYSLLIRLG